MPEEDQFITKEKKKELEKELEHLTNVRRQEIAEQLEYAKSLGDLSENAEYHQARADQATAEERIMKIENMLKYAQIVVHKKSDIVHVGSSVLIRKKNERTNKEFHIVGAEESDMSKGNISHASPLGRAMLGKKKGEKFTFITPGGDEVTYTLVDVK